jgi:L-fuculose-phosphate aldolase
MATVIKLFNNEAATELQRLQRELVLAHHILDRDGQALDIAGHITARLPGASTFWSNRFRLGFDEAVPSELHEADFDLNVVSGHGEISPALDVHAAVYRIRPDVNAIIHTHAPNAMALSSIGANLVMIDQQASIFFEDIVLFNEHHGVFFEGEGETNRIAAALGKNRAALLKNHGIVVVGATIQEAVIGAQVLEYAAAVQVKALAAGKLDPMPEAAARQSKKFLGSKDIYDWKFDYYARRVLRERPDLRRSLEAHA